jgi:hypothetical protein
MSESKFVLNLSRAALVSAVAIVALMSWQWSQQLPRLKVMFKPESLSLGLRAMAAVPSMIYLLLPIFVAAAGIAVQRRFLPATAMQFHLLSAVLGLTGIVVFRWMVAGSAFAFFE